jgi:recombination protein RecT
MAEQNQTSTALAKQPTKKQEVILAFNKVVNGGYIQNQLTSIMGKNAGSFTSSMIELFSQDSGLQECDPKAVVMEAMKAAALHLPLSKSLGRAYVLPFQIKGKATPTFVIGWRGLVDLAVRTGQYETINAICVYKGEMTGQDKLSGFVSLEGMKESNEVLGYLGYFKLTTGFRKMVFMTVEQMAHYGKLYAPTLKFNKITEEELIKKAQEQAEHGPQAGAIGWFGDFNAMALKTVVRKVLSWGPMSIELQNAIANDEDIQDAEVIRDEENSVSRPVVSASQMMQDAEATEVKEPEPEAAPI